MQGIPSSISATYYKCETKWLFPAVIGVCAVLALIPLLELTPVDWQFLGFFIVASVLFVAASPAFKDEFVGKVHTGAALVGGVSILAWLILVGNVAFLIPAAIAMPLDRKRWIFWLEVCLLDALYSNLLLLLIG